MNLAEFVTKPVALRPVPDRESAVIEYRVILTALLRAIRAELVASVLPRYAEYRRRANDGALVADEGEQSWFYRLSLVAAAAVTQATAAMRRVLGREIESFAKRFVASVKAGTGVAVPTSVALPAAAADDLLALSVQKNVALIKGLSDDALQRIERAVLDSRLNNESARKLAKVLTKEFGVLNNRAALIATDQIGSHHANLNRVAAKSVGLDSYVWVTQQDGNRVRPAHRAAAGMTGTWGKSSPLASGAHPGEEIRCRCRASMLVVPSGGLPDRVDVPVRTEFSRRGNDV